MTRGRILVVDDDTVVRSTVGRILEDEGYSVLHAADGVNALRQVEHVRPDVILLDVLMPRMNGKQVLEVLRTNANTSGIPVLVMTTVTGIPDGLAPGIADMVQKPFEVDELLDKVALAMYRRRETSQPVVEAAGVVLLVHPDVTRAKELEDSLTDVGFTTVVTTEISDELARLARALEPRTVVVALAPTTAAETALLRNLKLELEEFGVPVLMMDNIGTSAAEWATALVSATPAALANHIAASGG